MIRILLRVFGLIALILAGGVFYLSRSLPDVRELKNWQPPVASAVFDAKGRPIGDVAIQRRYFLPIEKVPKHVKQAFISAEDKNFYRHFGIDFLAVARASFVNLREGRVVQGASTITQQLARNLFLTPDRSWKRKLREAILAIKIERHFSKEKILEMYLNYIYLGQGAYGIEAASRVYFGKSVKDLTIDEAAILAGLPKAPTRYNPYRNPELIKARRDYVLRRMHEDGFLTAQELEEAIKKPIVLNRQKRNTSADYFLDYLKDYILDNFGEQVLAGGYKIYTTIDLELQEVAIRALKNGIQSVAKQNKISILPEERDKVASLYEEQKIDLSKRRIYIAKVSKVNGNYINLELKDLSFEIKNPGLYLERGDFVMVLPKGKRLEIVPDLQGAIVSLDVKTGAILAMVGGYSYERSAFNRAVDAKRQPGSAIKPVIYMAALLKGYTQASIIDASSRSFYDPSTKKEWTPSNYDGAEYSSMSLRTALAKSVNTASVNLLSEIGFEVAIDVARVLDLPLKPYYSAALGSIEVTPLELTSAYQTFANLGIRCRPYPISKIIAPDGSIFYSHKPDCKRVLPERETRVLVDMLRAVVTEGTAYSASSIDRFLAGKTGTTNDFTDAWFVGFSPQIVTGVWIGFDLKRSMGKGMAGSRVALPVWMDFMSVAAFLYPKEDFPAVPGVVEVSCPKKMLFVEGTEIRCSSESSEEEQKDLGELEGIVDPKFYKSEPSN
ncbi:MAG: PBP1A family penicillin-binding protein [Aquificaceae bacterium]